MSDQDGISSVSDVSNSNKKKRGRPKKEKGRVASRLGSRKGSRRRSKTPECPPLQPQIPTRTAATTVAAAPAAAAAAVDDDDAAVDDDDDDDFIPTVDSPSKNTRSRTQNNKVSVADDDDSDEDDSDVDEETYLNRLDDHYQGQKKTSGQLHRKADGRGRTGFTKDELRQRRMAVHHHFTTMCGSPDESTVHACEKFL